MVLKQRSRNADFWQWTNRYESYLGFLIYIDTCINNSYLFYTIFFYSVWTAWREIVYFYIYEVFARGVHYEFIFRSYQDNLDIYVYLNYTKNSLKNFHEN